MPKNVSTVTDLAKASIRSENIEENKYRYIGNVIEYLRQPNNFKTLSGLIIETMINKGYCKDCDDLKTVQSIFSKLLKLQDPDKNVSNNAKRLLYGETRRLESRKKAIKICFALQLNIEETNEFLNKLGYNSLLVRDPFDAICMYYLIKAQTEGKIRCGAYNEEEIKSGRIYKEAAVLFSNVIGMYETFERIFAEKSDNKKVLCKDIEDILARDVPKGYDWDSDDSFINGYLIQNKELLTKYARSFLSENIKTICEKKALCSGNSASEIYARKIREKITPDSKREKLPELELIMILEGYFTQFRKREQAVLFCEALGLNKDEKNIFLEKCGFKIDELDDCSNVIKQVYVEYEIERLINDYINDILRKYKTVDDFISYLNKEYTEVISYDYVESFLDVIKESFKATVVKYSIEQVSDLNSLMKNELLVERSSLLKDFKSFIDKKVFDTEYYVADSICRKIDKQLNDGGDPSKKEYPCFSQKNMNSILLYNVSFKYRLQAIEVCFAYSMSLERANHFLQECGFNTLCVFFPLDAIYIYCLKKNYGLRKANDFINQYYNAKTNETLEYSVDSTHSGDTTDILSDELEECSWEDEKIFMDSYLVPNMQKFLGYSLNSRQEYLKLKNALAFKVVRKGIKEEQELTSPIINDIIKQYENIYTWNIDKESASSQRIIKRIEQNIRHAEEKRDELREEVKKIENSQKKLKHFTNDLVNTLDKIYDENCPIFNIASFLRNESERFELALQFHPSYLGSVNKPNIFYKKTLCLISKMLEDASDNYSQLVLSIFFRDILSNKCLVRINSEGFDVDGDLREGIRDSVLYDELFYDMSNVNDLFAFETDPHSFNDNNYKYNTRKSVILLQYFSYLLDLSSEQKADRTKRLKDFTKETNMVLYGCRLPTLYPANQFDNLILRSIKDLNDLNLFDDVVKVSFDDYSLIEYEVVTAYLKGWNEDRICGEVLGENAKIHDPEGFVYYCINKFENEITSMQESGCNPTYICDYVNRKYGVEFSDDEIMNYITV